MSEEDQWHIVGEPRWISKVGLGWSLEQMKELEEMLE
jgi:hypothetical protein